MENVIYTPKDSLQDIVDSGIKFDLYAAETAMALYKTIGTYKSALAKDNFEHLFGSIQILLAKDIVLSVSKIFEKSHRYNLKSLPAAIKIIQDNHHKLKIEYRVQLEDKLAIWGLERKCLIAMTDSELTTIVAKILSDKMPSKDDMKAIKDIRDKRLAHNEFIDEAKISVILWQELDNLVKLTKTILGIIGNHYLGSLYEINGEYTLSEDALIESRSLVRLFRQAGIIS